MVKGAELIEAVRKRPALYNSNHPDHTRTKTEHNIWNNIAMQVNLKDGKFRFYTFQKYLIYSEKSRSRRLVAIECYKYCTIYRLVAITCQ